jgi:hypothetical protein
MEEVDEKTVRALVKEIERRLDKLLKTTEDCRC